MQIEYVLAFKGAIGLSMHLQCPRYACMKAREVMKECTIWHSQYFRHAKSEEPIRKYFTKHSPRGLSRDNYVITRTQCQEDKIADAAEDIVTLKPCMHCNHTGI